MPHFTFESMEGVKLFITTVETTNFPKIATTSFDQYGFTLYWKHPAIKEYILHDINTKHSVSLRYYNYETGHWDKKFIGESLETIMRAAKHIPSVGLLYWYVLSPPKHRV